MMNSRSVRILVVEDNIANLELFTDILQINGFECLTAMKGEDAIEIARMENPDMILLDIQMPGMDGMTVGRILKSDENTRHLKIVALTAHAMRGDKETFIKEGFDGYIPKPIKVKEFLEAVREYLG
jgi:two-component system cell cycle response regulator DivK